MPFCKFTGLTCPPRHTNKRFTLTPSLIERDTIVHIPLPQAGLYQISLYTTGAKHSVSQTMIATRLQSNVQCNQNQQIYSVYDSKSGKPIPKAKILLYKPNDIVETFHPWILCLQIPGEWPSLSEVYPNKIWLIR